MSEGFTYFNIIRRLKAAFFSPKNFKLYIFKKNKRYVEIEDAIVLRRIVKLKVREEDRIKFKLNVEKSFPDLNNLLLILRNNR